LSLNSGHHEENQISLKNNWAFQYLKTYFVSLNSKHQRTYVKNGKFTKFYTPVKCFTASRWIGPLRFNPWLVRAKKLFKVSFSFPNAIMKKEWLPFSATCRKQKQRKLFSCLFLKTKQPRLLTFFAQFLRNFSLNFYAIFAQFLRKFSVNFRSNFSRNFSLKFFAQFFAQIFRAIFRSIFRNVYAIWTQKLGQNVTALKEKVHKSSLAEPRCKHRVFTHEGWLHLGPTSPVGVNCRRSGELKTGFFPRNPLKATNIEDPWRITKIPWFVIYF
jgi:hypothetical protein